MVKLKTPLLSLDAHGSIADALTYQSSTKRKFTREKPRLPYSRTLSQQYQRWLYQDYACLWRYQTTATRDMFRGAGVRWHLTGFQMWMKSRLKTLPYLAGLWHLDEKGGAVARDYSAHGHHGTIIGASPAEGIIGGGFYFDNINDTVNLGKGGSLEIEDAITVECFVDLSSLTGGDHFLSKQISAPNVCWVLQLSVPPTTFLAGIRGGGAWHFATSIVPVAGEKTHVALTFTGTHVTAWTKGVPGTPTAWAGQIHLAPTADIFIGSTNGVSDWAHGIIDHVAIWTIALPAELIKLHSERRFP